MTSKDDMQKSIHILYVDDSEDDILLLKRFFQQSKYNIRLSVANNGEEGLELLKQLETEHDLPDFILVDVNMPILDGRGFMESVKSDNTFRLIPAMAFSSSREQKDINDMYSRYANAYLIKPFGQEEVKKFLSTLESFWLELSVLPTNEQIDNYIK